MNISAKFYSGKFGYTNLLSQLEIVAQNHIIVYLYLEFTIRGQDIFMIYFTREKLSVEVSIVILVVVLKNPCSSLGLFSVAWQVFGGAALIGEAISYINLVELF